MSSFTFEDVYQITQTIPKGMVATYGRIARALGTADMARVVGWALHVNRRAEVPCHRVVNKDGKLAENFGIGGIERQRRLLNDEGITFLDNVTIDLYLVPGTR